MPATMAIITSVATSVATSIVMSDTRRAGWLLAQRASVRADQHGPEVS